MAITKIKPIHYSLKKATDYSINPVKTATDGALYAAAWNCHLTSAPEDMEATKARWNKPGGVVCYRVIQSFRPGEVTPEQAHEIGVEFTRRYLSGRYEVVVGTHLDQGHIHNDITFNSVSFVDGAKFRNTFADYFGGIREVSDALCREYKLSVLDPQGKGKPYREAVDARDGKLTGKALIRADIDEAIRESFTFVSFMEWLKQRGYTFRYGPTITRPSLAPPGAGKRFRFDNLGAGYGVEDIKARLARQREGEEPAPPITPSPPGAVPRPRRYHHRGPLPRVRRLVGFSPLFWHYMYLLGKVKRRKTPPRITHAMRGELAKLQRTQQQFLFLHRHGIGTMAELREWQEAAGQHLAALVNARRPLYRERKEAPVEGAAAEITARITAANAEIAELRHIVRMCAQIGESVPRMLETIEAAQEAERQEQQQIQNRERQRPVRRSLPEL